MGTIKAKWKRAPIDQRRVASDRTIPNARFARKNLSTSLPPPLPGRTAHRPNKPLLMFAGALVLMVSIGVTLVIVVGAYIANEQQQADMEWRAAYYGRPTLPFSTLAPDHDPQQVIGTSAPYLTTPLPGISSALVSESNDPLPTRLPPAQPADPLMTGLSLAALDDPRWRSGTATPISGRFELRTLPSLANNEPLQTISQTVSCSFITEAEWGAWAQIKIGSSIAWVDTSTVKLEAAS